jgi:primase-polymerase (primpol)-like protein
MLSGQTLALAVPAEVKRLNHFVAWGPDPDTGRKKTPLQICNHRHRASSNKPSTWSSWANARAYYDKYAEENVQGVGFVFTLESGLVYIDIDDAILLGEMRQWCAGFVEPFLGKAYVEVSPSGCGIHIIALGSTPGNASGKKNFPLEATGDRVPEVAIFCRGKYTTLTGQVWKDSRKLTADCSAEIAALWASAGISASESHAVSGPVPDLSVVPEIPKERLDAFLSREFTECSAGQAADRSTARYHVYSYMNQLGFTPEEILRVVVDSGWYSSSGAEEHGLGATWHDIVRCATKAESFRSETFARQKRKPCRQSKRAAPGGRSASSTPRPKRNPGL